MKLLKEYLPFNKSLYIDACIYLPYRVDEFLRSLSDRELRIRAPIEEIRMLLDIPEGETERISANQNEVEPKTEENPDDTVEIIESVNLLEKNKERAQECFVILNQSESQYRIVQHREDAPHFSHQFQKCFM